MKRLSAIAATIIAGSLGSIGVSRAAYDGFGASFPVYANGGSGFSGPWSGSGLTLNGRSLCYQRLAVSDGSISGTSGSASRALFPSFGAGTLYLSFVLQPPGANNDGLSAGWGYFGLTLVGSTNANIFIGKPGDGASNEYAMENYGGFGQVSSSVAVDAGRPALLVVKVQLTGGNDILTLYGNPVPGRPEPATGVIKADTDLGSLSSLGISTYLTSGSSVLDEIRIGATYAEVTPAAASTSPQECF